MIGNAQTDSGDDGHDNDIAFTDVIFNLFSVLLIMLLIVPIAVVSKFGEAPTRNRENPNLVTIRDCYVETLRPTSQFILFSPQRLEIIDYDQIGQSFATSGEARFNVESWRATINPPLQGADANVFTMTLVLRGSPVASDAQMDQEEPNMNGFLDAEIYGRGYVPYFEVREQDIALFAPLFAELLADGRRFRWRIMDSNNAMQRVRTARGFESADFCR